MGWEEILLLMAVKFGEAYAQGAGEEMGRAFADHILGKDRDEAKVKQLLSEIVNLEVQILDAIEGVKQQIAQEFQDAATREFLGAISVVHSAVKAYKADPSAVHLAALRDALQDFQHSGINIAAGGKWWYAGVMLAWAGLIPTYSLVPFNDKGMNVYCADLLDEFLSYCEYWPDQFDEGLNELNADLQSGRKIYRTVGDLDQKPILLALQGPQQIEGRDISTRGGNATRKTGKGYKIWGAVIVSREPSVQGYPSSRGVIFSPDGSVPPFDKAGQVLVDWWTPAVIPKGKDIDGTYRALEKKVFEARKFVRNYPQLIPFYENAVKRTKPFVEGLKELKKGILQFT